MQNKKTLLFVLFGALVVIYFAGLFLPLMENDSAQHATMAMRMVNNNDFVHLYRGWTPYLDKPHMHFWLAALSMKIFGIHEWAYRLPAVGLTFLAAFGLFKLAKGLWNKEVGFATAIIFLSAQTIILANHDVRTDAVMTAFVSLTLWQLLEYVNKLRWQNAVLGGFFLAMAFSCKGYLAVMMAGIPVFLFAIFQGRIREVFSYKTILGLLAFVVGVLPISYSYFNQFGADGVRFIFWDQSLNRLNAEGFEKTNRQDAFFYFHTLLWTFLPWSLLFYFFWIKGFVNGIKSLKFENNHRLSLAFALSILVVLLVLNSSDFQLPHYINGLIPLVALFTAQGLYSLKESEMAAKVLNVIYKVLYVLVVAFVLVLNFFAFSMPLWVFVLFLVVVIFGLYVVFYAKYKLEALLLTPLCMALAINVYLNFAFYPKLLDYQAGIGLSKVNALHNQANNVYRLTPTEAWTFDFGLKTIIKEIDQKQMENLPKRAIILISNKQKRELDEMGFSYRKLKAQRDFHVSRLNLKFLNKETRPQTLDSLYLIQTE